jgi:hypothetical protein
MSSGRVWRRVPLGALPTAVRTLATITASRRTGPLGPDTGLADGFRAGFAGFGVVLVLLAVFVLAMAPPLRRL